MNFFKRLGPGLLFAGAAIGVSHIVQSTRAGALYSFELVIVVILANLLKLPILEMGVRYPLETREHLLHGYHKLGKHYLLFFLLITLCTMFIIQAAITVVTSGILMLFLPTGSSILVVSLIVLILASLILIVGKYSFLDNFVKFIIIALSATCILATLLSLKLFDPNKVSYTFNIFEFSKTTDVLFMMALIGWMPAPVDTSVWQSIWYEQKKDYKNAFFDFHIGYWTTTILALLFLSLGALVMFTKGDGFSSQAVGFASDLVSIFTSSIGLWAKPIIAFACLATMVSTTLTCLDAYPRVLNGIYKEIKGNEAKSIYNFSLIFTVIGTILVLYFFLENMKKMVDFATLISFLVTPIIGYFNFKLFIKLKKDTAYDNSINLVFIISLVFFSLFTIYFVSLKF